MIAPTPVGSHAPGVNWDDADPIRVERFARGPERSNLRKTKATGPTRHERIHVELIVLDNSRIVISSRLLDVANCGASVDIPVDGVWLNSGYFDGKRGDIHRL
jgi:hypothetical protein